MRSKTPLVLVLVSLVGLVLANRSLPRGIVHAADGGAPVEGALVVLEEPSGVRHTTRTNRAGHFRFLVNPLMGDGEARLLICAPDHLPMVSRELPISLFRAGFTPAPAEGATDAESYPVLLNGWRGTVPEECVPQGVAAAGETRGAAVPAPLALPPR